MGMNVLHRTVTKEDLASSFFTKLKQKHISAKEAAENMHLAQSTLSMWKEKKRYTRSTTCQCSQIFTRWRFFDASI